MRVYKRQKPSGQRIVGYAKESFVQSFRNQLKDYVSGEVLAQELLKDLSVYRVECIDGDSLVVFCHPIEGTPGYEVSKDLHVLWHRVCEPYRPKVFMSDVFTKEECEKVCSNENIESLVKNIAYLTDIVICKTPDNKPAEKQYLVDLEWFYGDSTRIKNQYRITEAFDDSCVARNWMEKIIADFKVRYEHHAESYYKATITNTQTNAKSVVSEGRKMFYESTNNGRVNK